MKLSGKTLLVIGFLGLIGGPATTQACGLSEVEPGSLPGGGEFYLKFSDEVINVGQFAGLELQFCYDGEALAVGNLRLIADMPAHGHGMNYQARIIPGEVGSFRVEGLLFHMPGEWRLRLDFTRQQNSYRFETRLTI